LKLSEQQIGEIRSIIDQSSINNDLLKDDVLDHLCCVVEYKITSGKPFDIAMAEAFNELAPDGLDEIQKETVFLLNSAKIILMKKVMYSIGLISAMSISMGWLFSILHWPGGGELINYGFFGFALVFVPMLTINQFKVNINKALSEKLRILLGLLSAIITCVAILFKIFHLKTAGDLMLFGGAIIFIFGFLPFLFFTMYKKSANIKS
jgi:hypothetical protein